MWRTVTGRFFEVIDLLNFVRTYDQGPDPQTISPLSNVDVRMYVLSVPLLPGPGKISYSATASSTSDDDGSFSVSCSIKNPSGYYTTTRIISYRGPGDLIYRRGLQVTLGDFQWTPKEILVYTIPYQVVGNMFLPELQSLIVRQEEVSDLMREFVRNSSNIKHAGATFGYDGLYIVGEGDPGGKVAIKLEFKPSEYTHIPRFLSYDIVSFDVDLPGPDFITGLCVPEWKIKRDIEENFSNIMGDFQNNVYQELRRQIPSIPVLNEIIARLIICIKDISYIWDAQNANFDLLCAYNLGVDRILDV